MAKLVLRDSCYNRIKDIKKNKIQNNLLHKEYVKEANKRIEKIGYVMRLHIKMQGFIWHNKINL